MIQVKMVAATDAKPLELASHAALKCYQSKDPQWGKTIDVENRLFKVGHHTTLQHSFFTFSIEGISVGDITFGMHLAHPFYNSDQRSGRYSSKMFLEPDFPAIEKYVKTFWPEVKKNEVSKISEYVKKGVGIYHKNISRASEISAELIKKERPFAGEKYVEANASKIAQEQARMFIPLVFPTGFDFTVNLTVLAAMYRSAWTPPMRFAVSRMVEEVKSRFPEVGFMFEKKDLSRRDWSVGVPGKKKFKVKSKPVHRLISIFGEKNFSKSRPEDAHPVDLLHYLPEMMGGSVGSFFTQIEISAATLGQDQRHRTLRRSAPVFSGAFYLPPVLKKMNLKDEALEIMEEWIGISRKIPGTLAMILAPYGAMVSFSKVGSFNAVAHEQAKRLCFCAQEEIYHAGLSLRKEIEKKKGKKSQLLGLFEPPCYMTGKCVEGARYCGRNIKLRKGGEYFPQRSV